MPKRSSALLPLVAIGSLLLPVAGEAQQTPLERANYQQLTSHQELVRFVEQLDRTSPLITVETLGYSVEGRRIPYLKISGGEFGADRDDKLMVLVFASQHGNEPSGKEAALSLARDIAGGEWDELLQDLDILLVPQVNPDGGEVHQRRNANNVDLNRSHLILNAPETIALRELFHRWEPEVTLDVHEYRPWVDSWLEHGFIRLFDEQYGLPTNLNVPEPIRTLANEEFLPFAKEYLAADGFTFHNYLVGDPESIRHSTTNINDGRQGLAILNTFSLIVEGKNGRGRSPTDNIQRRTAGQRTAIEALLHFSVEHKEEILATVRSARRQLVEGGVTEFVQTMSREQSPQPLSIAALAVHPSGGNGQNGDRYAVGDTIVAEIDNYFSRVVEERTIPFPEGYIVPAAEMAIIELLRKHQVEMKVLNEGDTFQVERFVIEGFSDEDLEGPTPVPAGSARMVTYRARTGDVFIPTAQLRGRLVATALDPLSMHGLLQYDEFENLRKPGPFPVMRIPAAR